MKRKNTPMQINQKANLSLVKRISRESRPETLARLHASAEGLSTKQAEINREEYGTNETSSQKRRSYWHLVLRAFVTPFTLVLLLLALISLCSDYLLAAANQKNLTTTAIMFVMIFISGTLTLIQDGRTEKKIDRLLHQVSVTTNIKRDGKNQELPTDEVVVGDVINLAAGDLVPADMRLLQSKDLFCSAELLNGEVEARPIEKIATRRPQLGRQQNLLDYPNVLFAGTTIVSGSGSGVVFATRSHSVFNRVDAGSQQAKKSSFDRGLKHLSRELLLLVPLLVLLLFLLNGLTKGNWLDSLTFAIAAAIGLTPQLLPAIVSSNLLKGSAKMARKGTVVKKAQSIQNMGSVDILCTDKTGTLTQGQVVLERHYDLKMRETNRILKLAYLNAYYQTGMKDLIDTALIDAAGDDLNVAEIQRDYNKIDEVPFDFNRKRMSVVVANSDRQHGEHLLLTKGDPEEILAVADKIDVDRQISPLTPQVRQQLEEQIAALNDDGLRVLLLAYKRNPAPVGELSAADEQKLTVVGFLSFLDPPKESAKNSLAQLAANGIKVKILTGDNESVARSVGVRVGLNIDLAYSSIDLQDKDPEELTTMVENCDLFVDLTPEDKIRIINILQQAGHSVAYMGDGINDAAAMKGADVSFSVDRAVDIAKESADVILLHKDLNVLYDGIRIGRQVFGNTMKYLKISLTNAWGNILALLLASCFLPFLPLSPVQLLILDLICGLTYLSLPADRMPESYLEQPRRWSVRDVPRFALTFGPLSTVADLACFAFLYFYFCPHFLAAGFTTLNWGGQTLFASLFNTAYLMESLLMQELLLHSLRSQSRQPAVTWPVLFASLAAVLVGLALVESKLGAYLSLSLLPGGFFLFLLLLAAVFVLINSLIKHFYLKHNQFLI